MAKKQNDLYFITEIKKLHTSLKIVTKYKERESEFVNESLKDDFKKLTKDDKEKALKILGEIHELLEYDFTYFNGEITRAIDSISENKIIKWEGYTPW